MSDGPIFWLLNVLLLTEALGRSGAFWLYGAIGLVTLALCWKFVPETKGKRLEDIQGYFQDGVNHRSTRVATLPRCA